MAEDCHSDKTPNVVRKDFLSDSTTKPGTEAVQPLVRQPDEDVDLHIPDEQLSIKSDAAAENRQTIDISPGDNFDTYAIAYICKDHSTYVKKSLEETKTIATIVASNSSHNNDMNLKDDEPPIMAPDSGQAASDSINNDVLTTPSGSAENPTDIVSEESQHVPNALNQNPMYVPNVQHPTACESSPQLTTTVASTLTSSLAGCSRYFPILPAVSNSSQIKANHDRVLEPITFGGFGTDERGQFYDNLGVTVSADNEIFVADRFNNRFQVFSINGTYLRNFPTVVPGRDKMMWPKTVAFDVEPDYLWVAGVEARVVRVVQYHKGGLPIKTFEFRFNVHYRPCPKIAIDVRNNKVILGEGDTIRIFQPNGSLVRSFQVLTGRPTYSFPVRGVASDCKGNVLLADSDGVKVYNHFGDKILESVGTYGRYRDNRIISLVVDPLGRIIVANTRDNRVDMFTSRGELVRTVANIKNPSCIAIGPGGHLVVSNTIDSTVTIFPRHVLFP
uniref:SMP-30/Gluconolactonase/LRE-like region domain-containing protein n=1 Tax=Branchiostoma floridae TaxID=7739 RepID=C3Z078_BRAFL|eukprot:XP_002598125.1 hypothetical protein BRAFLDRAFT_85657 [Branchiostoma floridae]